MSNRSARRRFEAKKHSAYKETRVRRPFNAFYRKTAKVECYYKDRRYIGADGYSVCSEPDLSFCPDCSRFICDNHADTHNTQAKEV